MPQELCTALAITEKLLSSASMVFALGFFGVLQSATPPTISFKSLPTDAEKRWAIYLLVLEGYFLVWPVW
jgi:hypothetical protein